MPVYRREDLRNRLPWVEIEDFATFLMDPRNDTGVRKVKPTAAAERVIVVSGEVVADGAAGRVTLRRNDWLSIPATGETTLTAVRTTAELMWIAGRWTETT